jgi:hypothetical protein
VHVMGRSAIVLPRQSSHAPQSLAHAVVFVHRGHAVVSLTLSIGSRHPPRANRSAP